MTAGPAALADRTVIIRDGRIASIAPSAKAVVPRGAKRISGVGKWLMPSLTDSHVHLENDRLLRLYLHEPALPDGTIRNADLFTPYVANGVLQVIDLSAMRETIAQRAEIESGKVLGPHIALAAMIDGDPPIWPVGMTRVAATPDAGRKAVDAAHEEGFEIIKAYSNLSLPTFTAIVAEARRLKMRVVGHIPGRDQGITEKFFQPGFDLVAHAEEFAQQTKDPSEADIPRYVEMSKHNGTWLIATLTLDDRILQEVSHPEVLKTRPEIQFITPALYPIVTEHNPYAANASPGQADYLRRVVAFNSKLVKAFADAGIPVLAGTDTPVPGLVAGFSLHDELEAMARAGLTNRKVLEGATRLPAEWLGVAGDRGTVASGKRADLLLLDADPLADVANTRRISAVVDGGRYLPRAVLDQLMNELKARYARARGSDGPN
ncbi:MAG: amidohydrolase family protein [Acidobacteriota bacterium]|nr:amidohydrolase family protein [Acidobacteriota bacterium]